MVFSNEPVVKVQGACIFQGINTILKDVNFSIEKDEFVFLIGRTGSGKSSLLKTLYADLPLIMGEAKVAGFAIEKIKKRKCPFYVVNWELYFRIFNCSQIVP